MKSKATIKDDGSCSSCDSDFAFYGLDFSAVDFENGKDVPTSTNTADDVKMPYGRHPETALEIDEVNVSETIKAIQYLKFPESIKSDLSCQKVRISAEMDTVVHDLVRAVPSGMDEEAKLAVDEEEYILLRDCYITEGCNRYDVKSGVDSIDRIRELAKMLSSGQYIEILDGVATRELLSYDPGQQNNHSVAQRIRQCVHTYCTSVPKCIEAEMIAVAALNLFMQCNYTGPSLHHGGCFRPGIEKKTIDESLLHVNPHKIFAEHLKVTEKSPTAIQNNSSCEEEPPVDPSFHNAVLGELSIAGEWPCSVSKYPYFLLFSRSILSSLSSPNRPDWTYVIEDLSDKIVLRKNSNSAPYVSPPEYFVSHVQNVSCAHLWCSRAIVAHNRLFLGDESPQSLWEEAKWTFEERVLKDCKIEKIKNKSDASLPTKTLLEYGLAEHHFDKNKKGKDYFNRAVEFCDLDVEITGSEGRRTKYQKRAVAQYLVRAKPTTELHLGPDIEKEIKNNRVTDQEVKLNEDSILLDKVKYVVEKDNVHHVLSVLQLTVLLALCLDVKNDNPMDGLTAEQMGAFLERVLQQHDDWMVYATGLLERAWLESERNHTKERAILQLQALADQHSNRLTLTQSTFKSAVEDSAPPQERLRHIHYIVYPPRWYVLKDLAERYARLGIVTSAAEIFQEIEMWDEVVECYRRAGKGKKAEEVVRKRLEENETPRMWAALGDITNEPSCYEKALVVSNGKFSDAHVALGKYYHEKGDLQSAVDHFRKAVQIKPLSPHIWFRLGTISMLLHDWQTALQSFTEVVQQEPEEGDAWANVAAIHIHNRNPEEAYPALNESLKINRKNWRVWISKLYTCMDLKKYDEAIQACNVLLDFKSNTNSAEQIPDLEEKIVRSLFQGTLSNQRSALEKNDAASIDSALRTLNRLRDLLSRLKGAIKETWLFELCAAFNESMGNCENAVEDLMKEYRSLQSYKGWETDRGMLDRACRVMNQVADIHIASSNFDELKKLKFLLNGMTRKIKAAYFDPSRLPSGVLGELDSINDAVCKKIEWISKRAI